MNADRVAVADPAVMRRAGRRVVRALVFVLVLTALFTVGGITAVARGDTIGVPMVVGAGTLDLACVAIVVASLRVQRSLDGDTVARRRLTAARATTTWVRRGVWLAVLFLVGYGVARLVTGDAWPLLVAVPFVAVLLVFARAVTRLGRAQDRPLTG